MNINLNLYKYFYVVAKNNSYTKAAEELMVSQPSISYSIKILEEQINKKLITRAPKGIELSKDGKELFEIIKPMMDKFDSLYKNENEMTGKIIIGDRVFHAQKMLPAKIRLINLLYPELDIEVKPRENEELIELLKNNKIDLLLNENDLNCDNIKSELLKVDNNSKICFFTNAKRNINNVTTETTKNEKILTVKSNKLGTEELKLYPEIKVENINSTVEMIEEVKINNRIGITSNVLLKDYIKAGEIKILNSEYQFPEIKTPYYVSYLKNNYNSRLGKIIEILRDYDTEEAEEALKSNYKKED